jgi:hypothetical protein
MNELEQLFQDMRRDYFPRWRNAAHWKIREGIREQWVGTDGETCFSTEAGYCDEETRTIWVNPHASRSLKVVLIHEICHAVAGKSHGQGFFNRMRKASERAAGLGDTELAAELQQHIEEYTSEGTSYWGSAPHVYTMVHDAIINTQQGAARSFDSLVDYLASELGMPPTRIRERYRKLRSVYESAHKERAEENAIMEQLKVKMGTA